MLLNPWVLAGAGAALLLLLRGGETKKQVVFNPPGTTRKWILELVGSAGGEGSYLVYAPANPPVTGQYPVFQFSQMGDNPATRRVVSKYPGVPPDVYKQALSDLGAKETF